jgi:hypothetical protein
MSETKHTPGPWSYWYSSDGTYGIGAENVGIFGTFRPILGGDSTQLRSNARLCAAAPDLYAALKDMIAIGGDFEDGSDCITKARAALAKAEGKP